MAIEYLGLSNINGPLVVLEGLQGAFFDEIVEFVVDGNTKKMGRIIELYEDKAIIQVFEGTENMSLRNTHTKLTGHPMEVAVSPEVLGRTFNGVGAPIDGLGTIAEKRRQRPAAEPGAQRVSKKLYPHGNLSDRRSDNADPRAEASDLLGKRTSPRPVGGADR